MSNPRRTAAPLLLALLLTLLIPGGAYALPAAPQQPETPSLPATTTAVTAAWDWLLSLVPPLEDLTSILKLPVCFEGSHLDPNGITR